MCAVTAGAALAWTANVDATTGSANLRGVAIAAGPLIVPLAVVGGIGRVRWWWLAIVGGLVAGPVRALFYDPFLDLSCVACRHSAAAIATPVIEAALEDSRVASDNPMAEPKARNTDEIAAATKAPAIIAPQST